MDVERAEERPALPPAPTRIATVEELVAAVADSTLTRLCLLARGSPFRLREPLRLARDVIVYGAAPSPSSSSGSSSGGADGGQRDDGSNNSSNSTNQNAAEAGAAVTIIGTITLSDGAALHSLCVRAPPPLPSAFSSSAAGATQEPTATVEILPSLRKSSPAWLHDIDLVAPSSSLPSPSLPSSSSSSSTPLEQLAPSAPIALRVCSGTTAKINFCRIRGAVVVCERAAPLLQSNLLSNSAGAGVELRATRGGCELRDNTIRGARGSGVLLSAKARATLADNRVEQCSGAGIEVTTAAAPLVLRNRVTDAGAVGLLVHGGGRGEYRENVVSGAWSSAVEIAGSATDATLRENKLLDGRTGVGVLVRDHARARLEGNEVAHHPLAGVEVSSHADVKLIGNSISGCGGCGLLVAEGGKGIIRKNKVTSNQRDGVECKSDAEGLTFEQNTITMQKHGAGVVVRGGGGGRWAGNTIQGNGVGVEVAEGAQPELSQCKIHGNLLTGVHVLEGGRASVRGCNIRSNGNGRLVVHEKKGARTHGDDAGAGVLISAGGAILLEGNQISMNAGPGVFAHADAHAALSGNIFNGNRGDAVAARPLSDAVVSEADTASVDHKRAVTPSIVRRQRVPFDWTVGANVGADDKSLAERVAEMRQQYEAMRDDKSSGGGHAGLAMLPAGADPSTVCVLQ